MKKSLLAVLLCSPLLAANASARFRSLPVALHRVAPYAALPMLMPAALEGALSRPSLLQPASIPLLAPSLVAAPAPALPQVAVNAEKENVRNPFAAVLPDAVMRLAPANDSRKPTARVGDDLRDLFDGSRRARSADEDRDLAGDHGSQSRRHSLPEDELESELGLGR